MVPNKFISVSDAYYRLEKDFPEQKSKVLINKERFEGTIKILRSFYKYGDIAVIAKDSPNYNELFCDDENYITDLAYDYFFKRIEEFDSILCDAKKENCNIPYVSSLDAVTTICPEKIKTKRHLDQDNTLVLIELIDSMKELYIRLDGGITMNLNNYCWLLGSSYTYERMQKYQMFSDECNKSQFGYKSTIQWNSSDSDSMLYRIDATCFEYIDAGIKVKKVLINDIGNISIDCIDGGILTNISFKPDFYYHLIEPQVVDFNKIYVVKEKAYEILNSLKSNDFNTLTKNEQRIEIIKYALENNLLEVDSQHESIPIYKDTKKDLFEFLLRDSNVSTKFENKNKSLFSTDSNEFFKSCKAVKSLIKFKSGRRKKTE